MSAYEIVPDLALCVVAEAVEHAHTFVRSAYDTADHVSMEVFVVAEQGLDFQPLMAEFSAVTLCPLSGNVNVRLNEAVRRSSARSVSF